MATELSTSIRVSQSVEQAVNDNAYFSSNMIQLNSMDWLITSEDEDFENELIEHLSAHGVNRDEYEIN